jgi:hypothetical protein
VKNNEISITMRCHMCQKEQVYVCESTKSVEKSIKEIKSKIVEDGWLPNRHLCQACSKPISIKKQDKKRKGDPNSIEVPRKVNEFTTEEIEELAKSQKG